MRLRQLAKLSLGLLRHPAYTAHVLGPRGRGAAPDLDSCLRKGADWLLKAQAAAPGADGYSRRYSLVSGWDRPYIETTGYIVPTLFDVGDRLGEPAYAESALRAARWLLRVQTPDGAFPDIDTHRAQVFDTGQVLLGLSRVYRETRDTRFLDAACRAADWLVRVQEADGSWLRFAYNDRPHAYYSRVGAAVMEAGLLARAQEYVDAGTRNLDWVLAQEQPNGYFRRCEFRADEDALLHTIVYVLEGFSMAFALTGERRWREALIRGVSRLKELANGEGLLYAQYRPDWEASNREYCVTGLAQYAGLCFDAFAATGEEGFERAGRQVMGRLCRWQVTRPGALEGALPSSVPVWGYYGGMDFYNWNVKFFLDGALKAGRSPSGPGERAPRA